MNRHIDYKCECIFSKLISRQIIFSFCFILFVAKTNAQSEYTALSDALLAEKIYLQLDRTIYSPGDVIWYKCIVTNAFDHAPSQVSGILHVELIGSDEKVYDQKLIKINNGLGEGYFYLKTDTPDGTFLIRAYTNWNRNFENDFFFEEYIRVLPQAEKTVSAEPISKITLIKNDKEHPRLQATLNPLTIDSLHAKKLVVIVKVDGNEETIEAEEKEEGMYRIEYEIPEDGRFATIQIQTSGGRRYSKTIILDKNYLDLQFFPESGELVNGISTKVGFKALDATGQGIKVEGDIVDENDTVIASFKSNELGMGSFYLPMPLTSRTYYGRLNSQPVNDEILLYPLPEVASKGNSLSVESVGDSIHVKAFSNYLEHDSISLFVSFRGIIFYDLKLPLKNGMRKFIISKEKIPEGIIAFTMLDHLMQPVAERLYFNDRPETRLNINLSTNKEAYAQRELTDLDIETTTIKGNPVKASLSVLVLNKKQLGTMQQNRGNILSYLLLQSELKGEIEHPGYYFMQEGAHPNEDMDVLMLTQGWRKYNYCKPYDSITFSPEYKLSVSGVVGGIFNEEKGKKVDVTLMTTSDYLEIYSRKTDSLGRFKFFFNDRFGKDIKFLLQTKNNSGKKKNYSISLDKELSPPIEFRHVLTIEKPDSTMEYYATKNEERKKNEVAFPLQSGNIFLEEVEVIGYRNNPARKKVVEEYGKPDEIIDGAVLAEMEKDWSTGLFSALDESELSELLVGGIVNRSDSKQYTAFVIDGIPVKEEDYNFMQSIPTSEVVSIEVIKNAKNFENLHDQVIIKEWGYSKKDYDIQIGNVVAIYTRAQKGLYGAIKSKGILEAEVPAFSKPIEFYAPKYDSRKSQESSKPDLRALVHWEPLINADKSGKAAVSFYNADIPGDMLIVVEAISETGQIGYQEIIYHVEGEDKERLYIEGNSF